MVGVSDPTRSSNELRAFVQWYWTGSALGTLTTVGFVFSVVWGTGLRLPLPIVISTTLLFGTLDLIGKTPMAQRQTPQRLIRFPNASVRGLVWGFDIGLLWSTRKTSSLIWSGLIVLSLTRPSIGIPAVLATSLVYLVPLSVLAHKHVVLMRFLSNTPTARFRIASFAFHCTVAALLTVQPHL
jgi:hypothetical protein